MTTQEAIEAYLEAVSAVARATKDPSVAPARFDELVAEREVLRRELRGQLVGVVA